MMSSSCLFAYILTLNGTFLSKPDLFTFCLISNLYLVTLSSLWDLTSSHQTNLAAKTLAKLQTPRYRGSLAAL